MYWTSQAAEDKQSESIFTPVRAPQRLVEIFQSYCLRRLHSWVKAMLVWIRNQGEANRDFKKLVKEVKAGLCPEFTQGWATLHSTSSSLQFDEISGTSAVCTRDIITVWLLWKWLYLEFQATKDLQKKKNQHNIQDVFLKLLSLLLPTKILTPAFRTSKGGWRTVSICFIQPKTYLVVHATSSGISLKQLKALER